MNAASFQIFSSMLVLCSRLDIACSGTLLSNSRGLLQVFGKLPKPSVA